MQTFTVASGIIIDNDRIVFVQNKRRNGSLDWSTPGGVVDPGEQVIEALQREVVEETALTATGWSPLLYSVDVNFVERDLTLHAEIFVATGFHGELVIDDPDNVVVDGRWVAQPEAMTLLGESPQWVAQPLSHALESVFTGTPTAAVTDAPAQWIYDVTGGQSGFSATLLAGPSG